MEAKRLSHRIGAALIAASAAAGCGGTDGSGARSDVTTTYEALASAVGACGMELGACSREAAGDTAALQACRDEFATCRANAGTPPASDQDAGGNPPVAIRACIDTLLDCIGQGGDARACAEDVRACILDAAPASGGMMPDDPGSPAEDAGMNGEPAQPPVDAAAPVDPPEPPVPDAGMAGDPPGIDCRAAFEACLAAGGSRQSCGMQQRECAR